MNLLLLQTYIIIVNENEKFQRQKNQIDWRCSTFSTTFCNEWNTEQVINQKTISLKLKISFFRFSFRFHFRLYRICLFIFIIFINNIIINSNVYFSIENYNHGNYEMMKVKCAPNNFFFVCYKKITEYFFSIDEHYG